MNYELPACLHFIKTYFSSVGKATLLSAHGSGKKYPQPGNFQ